MSMDDLERRALLGDRQAQDECTRQGIALPCPCCGRLMVKAGGWFYHPNLMCIMGLKSFRVTDTEVLDLWNRRHRPPIGRCKDCANGDPENHLGIPFCFCRENRRIKDLNDWCSSFKPKGREHET